MSNKKIKVAESTTTQTQISPYKPGALSAWLQTSSSLGGVEPIPRDVSKEANDDEDEDEDDYDDDEEDDASEDERLLQLRRLEDGTDWMALYEKIMREGDGGEEKDDDDDDEYDDEAQKRPTFTKKNHEKKSMAAKKAAQAAAKGSVPSQPLAQSAIRAGGVALSSDAANVAILPRNSSTAFQKKQQLGQQSESSLQPAKSSETKKTFEKIESSSSQSIGGAGVGAGGVKRSRPADETIVIEKKEKRELPKPFVPFNPAGCVFVSNIPEGTPPEAISKLLSSSFGKVKTVHYEKSNQGKDCSFGYVEFESQSSVKAAVASTTSSSTATATATATGPSIGGRTLKIDIFTPESNYRNADGSRRRNKKENKKKEKVGDQEVKAKDGKTARDVQNMKKK